MDASILGSLCIVLWVLGLGGTGSKADVLATATVVSNNLSFSSASQISCLLPASIKL